MNWWELVLIGTPGLLALAGVIYGEYRKRKNAREEADRNLQARREPTWNELVTENRNLRADVNRQDEEIEAIRASFAQHKDDFNTYKRTTNRKFRAFENMLRDVFSQWPLGFEHPLFNSDDLSELRDADIPWKDRIRIP